MHRWFRFCAGIALISFVHQTSAQESLAVGEPPAAKDFPTPGKHQLRATPLQIVQHRIEQQNKQIDSQGQQVGQLAKQFQEQATQIQEQTTQIQGLKAQIEAMQEKIDGANGQTSTLQGQFLQLTNLVEELKKAQASTPSAPSPLPRAAATEPPPESSTAETSPAPESSPTPQPHSDPPPPAGPVHIVKKGENLTTIARQHGTTVAELLKLNKIEDERKLQIGQTLLIPNP